MISLELLFALVATSMSIISIIAAVFSLIRERRATKEKKEALERVLAYTKQETFQSTARLFDKRRDLFRVTRGELKSMLGEPWIDHLAEIVIMKRKEKGE